MKFSSRFFYGVFVKLDRYHAQDGSQSAIVSKEIYPSACQFGMCPSDWPVQIAIPVCLNKAVLIQIGNVGVNGFLVMLDVVWQVSAAEFIRVALAQYLQQFSLQFAVDSFHGSISEIYCPDVPLPGKNPYPNTTNEPEAEHG